MSHRNMRNRNEHTYLLLNRVTKKQIDHNKKEVKLAPKTGAVRGFRVTNAAPILRGTEPGMQDQSRWKSWRGLSSSFLGIVLCGLSAHLAPWGIQ